MNDTEVPKVVDAQIVEAEITRELGDVLSVVEQYATVTDDEGRARAVQLGVQLGDKERSIKALKERLVKPIRLAYENVRDTFDGKLSAVVAGKRLLSVAVSTYDIEKERQARLERERQEADRREKQRLYEIEQAKLKLEQDHLDAIVEDVQRAKAAQDLADQLERDRRLREEQDARVTQAETAQDLGMVDRVDNILDRATPIAPTAPSVAALQTTTAAVPAPLAMAIPVIPPPPPPAPAPVASFADDGTIKKNVWKWEVADIKAFCQGVADGSIPAVVEYRGKKVPIVEVNRGFIGQEVGRLKDEFTCPGIKTWKERNTIFKAANSGEEA